MGTVAGVQVENLRRLLLLLSRRLVARVVMHEICSTQKGPEKRHQVPSHR